MATIKRNSGMKKIIIILAFLVCGISSAQQYFFNGTVYVPKTTVQINAIVSPPEGRVEANSDTGSLWYFDGTIWKDTFVGVSSFEDLEGDPYDNAMLSDALNSKANDSAVVKINPNSLVSPLTLAVSDSTTIASGIFSPNTVVIDTTTRTPGGDEFVTGGNLSGAGVLTLNRNYGSPIQITGFNSSNDYNLLLNKPLTLSGSQYIVPNNLSLVTYTDDNYASWVSNYTSGSRYVRSIFTNSGSFWRLDPSGSGDSFGYNFTTGNWVLPENTTAQSPTLPNQPANKSYVDSSISSALNGATGSFTSQDGKTITVTNGIITNIETP